MKVLVYPFGTEIAFEIYRSLSKVKNIELWGGTSDYNNHGLYVYDNVIGDLQFISDFTFAGLPNAFTLFGTSFITTEPAPTKTFSPILIP